MADDIPLSELGRIGALLKKRADLNDTQYIDNEIQEFNKIKQELLSQMRPKSTFTEIVSGIVGVALLIFTVIGAIFGAYNGIIKPLSVLETESKAMKEDMVSFQIEVGKYRARDYSERREIEKRISNVEHRTRRNEERIEDLKERTK